MRGLPCVLLLPAVLGCSSPEDLHVATTTSVEASGLLDRLAPAFERHSGMHLRVVAVGTGQALELLRRGDVVAAITHDPEAEKALVERRIAQRVEIMKNDFLLVGPESDPAHARGRSIEEILRAIAAGGHPFVSRGDDSGTHRAERRLWKAAGIEPRGPAYREVGQGMAETLAIAGEMAAYTLVDSATFATLRSRVRLAPMVLGDVRLGNTYSVLWRNRRGRRFALWLRSEPARSLMRPLFEPLP